MIVKLKGVEGSRMAALWAIAEKPEFQYVFDRPEPLKTISGEPSEFYKVIRRPAVKVLECKAAGDNFEMVLEIAHGHYYIEEQKGDLEAGKGKKVPIPRGLPMAVFNALNLYPDEAESETSLLKWVIAVPAAGAAKFVAKDHLKEANIGWTGENFKKFFLEKVEENVSDAVIAVHRLERASEDASIRAELGARVEIKLAHFFSLFEAQSKGQKGALAVDGSIIIAYIIGNDGNPWAVFARWYSGSRYWRVGARSVERPYEWYAGDQVLACDSL